MKTYWAVAISVFIFVVLLWTGSGYWVSSHFGTWKDPGGFGSSYGYIAALFSGLSLAGIAFTLTMQQKQMRDTQKRVEGIENKEANAREVGRLVALIQGYQVLLDPNLGGTHINKQAETLGLSRDDPYIRTSVRDRIAKHIQELERLKSI